MPIYRENTLKPELLQVHSMTLFPGTVSASRADMFASEIGQAPPLKDANVRRLLTGMERRFGEYTDSIRMPTDGSVVKVIFRRPANGMTSRNITLEKTIVFRDVATGCYDCVTIPIYCCNHQQLGFDYKQTNVAKEISKGLNLAEGTILADSPSIDEHGNYKFGINGKIAFMSLNNVAQDGAIISESFAKRAAFKGYGTRTLSFGEDTIPLNMFGKNGEYKIFPDVGEKIPKTGLLFVTRELREELIPVQMSRKGLQEWDITDKRTYAIPDATVVKVEVFRNNQIRNPLPEELTSQCRRYHAAEFAYYNELIQTYQQIKHEEGVKPLLSPTFHELVKTAVAFVRTSRERSSLNITDNGNPLNEYTVTIHFSYDLIPDTVFKMADTMGGKAVIVEVWPDDRMPVDKRGVRAEVIMDGGSIVNRLNPGRLYEQFINGALDTAWIEVRKLVEANQDVAVIWDYILKLYNTISPKFANVVKSTVKDCKKHIDKVYKEGFYIWFPTDNPIDFVNMALELERDFTPFRSSVTYKLADGTPIETERPVLIADQYFIFLEKIGDDYSAVSSPVLQPQGIPGKLTRADKYSSPGRPQAIRGIGETELRILEALTDTDVAGDMLDVANSATTHRWVNRQLLTHPTPTNIQTIIPRDIIPRGNNRITQHVNNFIMAGGFTFEYRKVEE